MTEEQPRFVLDPTTASGHVWLKILEATYDGEWHRWTDLVQSLAGVHPAKTVSNRIADVVKAGHLERRGGPRRQASVRRRIPPDEARAFHATDEGAAARNRVADTLRTIRGGP